jgi:integrase
LPTPLLFAATSSDDLHALWVLLATTGLRIGEALGLKWTDIDFENQRLFVRRALQRQKENGLVFVEPKTAKSRRMVYFAEGTGAALKDHRKTQNEARLRLGDLWQTNDLIFCRADGTPLDPGNVTHHFQVLLKRAGLKKVRVHDLRHTAASLHLARGENPKVGPGDARPQHHRRNDGHLLARHACASRLCGKQNAGFVRLSPPTSAQVAVSVAVTTKKPPDLGGSFV